MAERLDVDRLRDLESVTDAALAYLPLEQLLSELLTRVVDILEADTAAILLLDDDGRTLVAVRPRASRRRSSAECACPCGRASPGESPPRATRL